MSQALGATVTRREREMVKDAMKALVDGEEQGIVKALDRLMVALRGDTKRRELIRAKITRTGEMFHGQGA